MTARHHRTLELGQWRMELPNWLMPSLGRSRDDAESDMDDWSYERILRLPFGMDSLASGLWALLVTDLEGFTNMVEHLGDTRSLAVMRRHNRALRHCVRSRRGLEVAHTGDGLIAKFRSVADALECARDVQRSLSDHNTRHPDAPLRARVGVHAGEPLPEDGRLFGQCVIVAVRVCSHAPAGSVLVTEVVKQLATGRFTFEPGVSHTLKGLRDPMRLYELGLTEKAPLLSA